MMAVNDEIRSIWKEPYSMAALLGSVLLLDPHQGAEILPR